MISSARPLVMRIITRLAGGGPPVHATLLNRNLPAYGFDSVLVFGDCSSEECNMEYLLKASDPVVRISALSARFNPFRDLLALLQLWRLIRIHRPLLVHTHTAKAGLLGRTAAVLAGVPYIVHTFHGHVLQGYFGPATNWLIRQIERVLGLISTALFTVSPQQADELSRHFHVAAPDKFHVVPLGIDLSALLALPFPDFTTHKLTVGWLGRFVPIKNMGLLVEIASMAKEKNLPVDFLIAGDGVERGWLEKQIESQNLANIRLLPWQHKIDDVLAQCHLLLLTSHREGTPLALIQGMSAGRPFIATPSGGTVDLATGVCRTQENVWSYDNCVLARPKAECFIEAFENLLANRDQLLEMAKVSRQFAVSNFDQDRLAMQVANLYQHLIEQQRTGNSPVHHEAV